MSDETQPHELPTGIERYVACADLPAAASSIEYAWLLLRRGPNPPKLETVGDWCYEFAAAGAPYWDWADLAMARHRDGDDPGALGNARRDAMAHALIDYGENESVRKGHGRDSQWS
jgi:hypothetical protein